MTCTWDPATCPGNITLSPGNLIASLAGSGANRGCVLATVGKSSGKWYWEIRVNSASAPQDSMLGVAQVGVSTTQYLGSDAYGWSYEGNTLYHSGTSSIYNPGYTTGDTLGFMLDATAQSLDIYVNDVLVGTVFSSMGAGTYYPAAGPGYTSANPCAITAHFSAASLTYAPKSGSLPIGGSAGSSLLVAL